MVKLKPLYDRVLVERVEQEQKTAGGIIIPDTAQEKPMEGRIVAVGEGTRDESGKLHPLSVKVGDRIVFAKWGGNEIKVSGNEYLIMKESDILAVVLS
jgi:chaperonin GroES